MTAQCVVNLVTPVRGVEVVVSVDEVCCLTRFVLVAGCRRLHDTFVCGAGVAWNSRGDN